MNSAAAVVRANAATAIATDTATVSMRVNSAINARSALAGPPCEKELNDLRAYTNRAQQPLLLFIAWRARHVKLDQGGTTLGL
jgi:hypothetical protein